MAGLEPATYSLTGSHSTIELHRSKKDLLKFHKYDKDSPPEAGAPRAQNLQPSAYTNPNVSKRSGLYLHHSHDDLRCPGI